MLRSFLILVLTGMRVTLQAQTPDLFHINLVGVYQGKTLFIQNPYNAVKRAYCLKQIMLNNNPLSLNYQLSAIKLDFEEYDLYTPITVTIWYADTLCIPVIINPDAILFHTIFRFSDASLTDTSLTWSTKGERGIGAFEIEKLKNGTWNTQEIVKAKGIYEGANYFYLPKLEEGANKYRVKYHFPEGSRVDHLYSMEMDHDYYPEPIDFNPKSVKTRMYLSRYASYEIFNAKNELILTGEGLEIDLTKLRRGRYSIYFNGKDPGTFVKE